MSKDGVIVIIRLKWAGISVWPKSVIDTFTVACSLAFFAQLLNKQVVNVVLLHMVEITIFSY